MCNDNNPFANFSLTIEPYFEILNESIDELSPKIESIEDSSLSIKDAINNLSPKIESIRDSSSAIKDVTTNLFYITPSNLGSIPGELRNILNKTIEIHKNVEEIKAHHIKNNYSNFLEFLRYNSQLFTVMGVFGTVSVFLNAFISSSTIKYVGVLLATSIFVLISTYIIIESRKIKDNYPSILLTSNFITKNLFLFIFSLMVMLIILNAFSSTSSTFMLFGAIIILSFFAFFSYLSSEIFRDIGNRAPSSLYKIAYYSIGIITLILTLVCYNILISIVSPESAYLLPLTLLILNNLWWGVIIVLIISLLAILFDYHNNYNTYNTTFSSFLNQNINFITGYNILRWVFIITLIYLTAQAVNSVIPYQKDPISNTWINNTNNVSCIFYPNNTFFDSSNNVSGMWSKITDINYGIIVYNSQRLVNVSVMFPDKSQQVIYFNKDPANLLYASETGYYYTMNKSI